MSNVTQALEHVVTKSNKLVEASYRLSVPEQRIVALLASKVAPADEDFKLYDFTVSELGGLLGFTGKHLHGQLQETTEALLKRVMKIREPDGLRQVNWIGCAKYYNAASDRPGTVELSFHPSMKPYMLQLHECFTSYRLKNIIRLRSAYSVRLYELLMQYAVKGERTFGLEELRDMLAIEAGTYKAWQDFQRNVLNPARTELAEHTDLSFTYQTKKAAHGRVVGVVFRFKLKTHERALKHAAKKASEAGITKLGKQAAACLESRSGKCDSSGPAGHPWEKYQSDATAFCHWCPRFDTQRNELAGQTRLPGLD